MIPAYEKLGFFYLGKTLAAPAAGESDLLLYDSRDLTTHAVCVGMTGSGKTGLCIGLLEEAAIDSIPSLIIDPKGDLANLLLTFPDLRAEDFRPWIAVEEAERRGLSPDLFAAQQAESWARGLAEWGQDGERIRRLRAAAEFTVYTPGSRAGQPVSVLQSFAAPAAAMRDDTEALRERIGTTVQSLLGLLGIEADPLQSRDHILLASLLENRWQQGQDLDLAMLVRLVQEPPMPRIGVVDLETFYPAAQRFALAMRINNLLASPGFQGWLEGEPLDVQRLLYTQAGKPRVAIFSIAHLGDAERMFFVSLLFGQVLGWVRTQTGTSSLRALLYMDEIAGYLPPTANPPSKPPLLTLLKQARAFGLGVVLSTQNPVDLDYKALSNAGTWFIGRLQTERDKLRLLDGLESAGGGAGLERQDLEKLIAGLEKRVFLLHDVHRPSPVLLRTRWTLSYLRGPMTREEIKRLPSTQPATTPSTSSPASDTAMADPPGPDSVRAMDAGASVRGKARPMLPPGIAETYFVAGPDAPAGQPVIYRPMLCAQVQVGYVQARPPLDHTQRLCLVAPFPSAGNDIDWSAALEATLGDERSATTAADTASYEDLPPAAATPKYYAAWRNTLTSWLCRNRTLTLQRSASLGVDSRPGESEGDFKVRLRDLAREGRDQALAKLRAKHAARFARLQEKVRRAEAAVGRESEQMQQAQAQTAISIGAAVLGAVLGGRRGGTLGRATTAARGAGRAQTQAQDVARARADLEAARAEVADFEAAVGAETEELGAGFDAGTLVCETLTVRPKRTHIAVERIALAWVPCVREPGGALRIVAALRSVAR
ncbi:MAG TPA: ATP-binding protein [Candidatus Krumholzibacteria bacterium]|nr:ATP-binding protein [Candidatus Krumholzibacteria bacterium]